MKNIILVIAFLLGLSYQAWGEFSVDEYEASSSDVTYRNDETKQLLRSITKGSVSYRTQAPGANDAYDASPSDYGRGGNDNRDRTDTNRVVVGRGNTPTIIGGFLED